MIDGPTREEWLKELQKLNLTDDEVKEGFTTAELCGKLGKGMFHVKSELRKLIKAGLWEFVGKSPRPTISGGTCQTPIYRPVEK